MKTSKLIVSIVLGYLLILEPVGKLTLQAKQPNAPSSINPIATIKTSKALLDFLQVKMVKNCGIHIKSGGSSAVLRKCPNSKCYCVEVNLRSRLYDKDDDTYYPDNQNFGHTQENTSKFPLLITSFNGSILSSGIGFELPSKRTNHSESKLFENNKVENKLTIIKYLYPFDSSLTNEELQLRKEDTSKYNTVFYRFTAEEVEQEKRETKEINDSLYQQLQQIANLIPIRIESECPNYSVLAWYEKTPALIKYLTQNALTDDRGDINKQVFQSLAITKTVGTVNYKKKTTEIQIELKENQTCSFSLYDMEGKFVWKLAKHMKYAKGNHTFTTSYNNVSSGVYLLSMLSGSNKPISRTIIAVVNQHTFIR
ncbi:MAG: T9SS type A sorting domain-containing protein [Bacteroidetes bacterium]|nr:T9SS type A sorting domain-containing protein [Bacteroidota bacterium]